MPRSRIVTSDSSGIPRAAKAAWAPASRSITVNTRSTTRPNSCARSIASSDDPPVLTLHGDQDVLVPISQAKKLDEKMKQAGADHTLMVLPGQGHDFVGEDQQKAMRAMWAFFDRNLKSR